MPRKAAALRPGNVLAESIVFGDENSCKLDRSSRIDMKGTEKALDNYRKMLNEVTPYLDSLERDLKHLRDNVKESPEKDEPLEPIPLKKGKNLHKCCYCQGEWKSDVYLEYLDHRIECGPPTTPSQVGPVMPRLPPLPRSAMLPAEHMMPLREYYSKTQEEFAKTMSSLHSSIRDLQKSLFRR